MNEKNLTTEQTAQEPKKPTKKKSTKTNSDTAETTTSTEQVPTTQDASQPEHENSSITTNDLEYHEPSESDNANWNWYNQLQSIETKDSHGGSNQTHPFRRRAQKRAHKTRIQKNSRRINRYIK